jgi:regulator of replication initiation timing
MTKKETPAVLAALDAAVVADYDAEISALKGQTQQLLEDLGKLTAERNNLKSLVQQSHKVVEEYKRGYVQLQRNMNTMVVDDGPYKEKIRLQDADINRLQAENGRLRKTVADTAAAA